MSCLHIYICTSKCSYEYRYMLVRVQVHARIRTSACLYIHLCCVKGSGWFWFWSGSESSISELSRSGSSSFIYFYWLKSRMAYLIKVLFTQRCGSGAFLARSVSDLFESGPDKIILGPTMYFLIFLPISFLLKTKTELIFTIICITHLCVK